MDDGSCKELRRKELKKKNKGKGSVVCQYRPKYPDSAEREYLRLVNEYMAIEKEILMKYIPEIKKILNEGTRYHTDSKKENEQKRKVARFSAIDNTIVQLTILFKKIKRELDAVVGLYDLKRQINKIADLDHKLTVREWKKAVSKTLGIDLLEDYYFGDYYKGILEKWVSDNVELITTIPSRSLDKMKEIVYQNYMKGATTTDIVKEIQQQYGMSKRHARLIARDQTAKLNAEITKSQQTNAGIKRYKWSDSRDERVRKSHKDLNGHIFNWNEPPETEKGRKCHPGEDYQCRCCAIPVFDIDTLDLPV